jgi:hypothetical protein
VRLRAAPGRNARCAALESERNDILCLTDASDRPDLKVLVSYWLPALVATFAGVGILGLLIGPPLLDAWVNDLDGVDQIDFAIILLGITSILAHFFTSMRRPILYLFMGGILPRRVADRAIRRAQRTGSATSNSSRCPVSPTPMSRSAGGGRCSIGWASAAVPVSTASTRARRTAPAPLISRVRWSKRGVDGTSGRVWLAAGRVVPFAVGAGANRPGRSVIGDELILRVASAAVNRRRGGNRVRLVFLPHRPRFHLTAAATGVS